MSDAVVVGRGAISVVLSGPALEPPDGLRERVEELWEQERRVRPGLVDGSMISVTAVDGNRVETRPCPYRLFVARERDTALRERLGVRALGVSGALIVNGEDGGRSVLLGRRSAYVTEHAGAWELVPSGGIEPELAGPDGVVDVVSALLAELEEEVGLPHDTVVEVSPLGLVHDVAQDVYDVCLALHVREPPPSKLAEYDEALLLPAPQARDWLHAEGHTVVPTSRALLDLAGDAGLL